MDIIDLLTKDHAETNELFRRFNLSTDSETRDQLAREVVHELSVHAAVEEIFVYPLIRAKLDDGNELADHSIDEHAEVKRFLTSVEKLEAGSREHTTTVEQVAESVRHHVEEEEAEIFPKLREATSADERDKLGKIVDRAKAVVPTHPHPLVPGTASAQLVAGPWASIIDKVRDISRVG